MDKILTTNALRELIAMGEGLALEFKRSATHLGREICAFANSAGGRILVGVDDAGAITGIGSLNRVKSEIQNMARAMEPSMAVGLDVVGEVLVVTVPSGPDKPYSANGKFYLRDAATCQQMSREEIREFFFKEGLIQFDRQPCSAFSMPDDFDARKYKHFTSKATLPRGLKQADVLKNLQLVCDSQMTNAGALLFSKAVSKFFLQASVVCVLFQGTGKSKVLDKQVFADGAISDFQKAMRYLLSHLNTEYIIGAGAREEKLELPEAALREALLNAIAHRDYRLSDHIQVNIFQDRVEVINPGGLVAGLRKKDLGRVSRPRNPLLFSMLERMDLVENIGSGIKRMRDSMQEYGLPAPAIDIGDTWFSIAFSRVGQSFSGAKKDDGSPRGSPKSSPKGSPKTKDLILEMIQENSKISTAEIGEKLGISKRSVIKQTNKLKETDRLERIGSPRGGYWRLK